MRKKVINGGMYDTKAAEMIGRYYINREWTEGYKHKETLYRMSTGEFFVLIRSWAYNMYWDMTKDITEYKPLTVDEAKKWAEKYLSGDEYVATFGKVEE